MHKKSLNNFICHLPWFKKLSLTHTHPKTHELSKPYDMIFWVRVTHKMLNVNWEKIHSIILSVTCHGLRHFAPAHTHPYELLKPYEFLFFEFEFWPTPPHPFMTHPTLPHPFMTHPTPPLYDTPHPTPPLHDPPTPPHPTLPHPTPPHPTPSWPTPPTLHHPFTPPLHDPPHPTPGTFLGTKEPFFMGCFTMSPSR